jgi:hypothetical protein
MDLLHLQFSLGCSLDAPYNAIPKRTLLSELKALTAVNEVKNMDYSIRDAGGLTHTDAAYRLLQRLVTQDIFEARSLRRVSFFAASRSLCSALISLMTFKWSVHRQTSTPRNAAKI